MTLDQKEKPPFKKFITRFRKGVKRQELHVKDFVKFSSGQYGERLQFQLSEGHKKVYEVKEKDKPAKSEEQLELRCEI